MLRRSALLSLSCLAVASAFIPAVPAPQQTALVRNRLCWVDDLTDRIVNECFGLV